MLNSLLTYCTMIFLLSFCDVIVIEEKLQPTGVEKKDAPRSSFTQMVCSNNHQFLWPRKPVYCLSKAC